MMPSPDSEETRVPDEPEPTHVTSDASTIPDMLEELRGVIDNCDCGHDHEDVGTMSVRALATEQLGVDLTAPGVDVGMLTAVMIFRVATTHGIHEERALETLATVAARPDGPRISPDAGNAEGHE